MKRKYKTCKNCEKSFFGRGKIFCSNLCKGFARKTRTKKNCENCNKQFEVHIYSLKAGWGRFCSSVCKGKFHSKSIHYEPNLNCKNCNKPFYMSLAKQARGLGIYCSLPCARTCMIGVSPPNKGIPMPQEQRIKLSIAGMGKMIGALNSAWKGGVTSFNHLLRESVAMRLWREAVFKRDDFTCKWCKIKGGKLHADHIKMFAFHPELRTEVSNGQTLCELCHAWKTKWDLKIFTGKVPELNLV